jgi:hypothetical protein
MKKIYSLFFFLSISLLLPAQKADSITIQKEESEISQIKDSQTLIKEQELLFRQELLALKKELYEVRKETDEQSSDFFIKYFSLWMTIGAIIGAILSFFSLHTYSKNKLLAIVDTEITRQFNTSLGIWEIAIKRLEKHHRLRETKKVKLIQKGAIPDDLLKILKLFNFDKEKDVITVDKLEEAYTPENLAILKSADIIVLENKNPGNIWHAETPDDQKPYIKLVKKVTPFAAIAYYGDEHFPMEAIQEAIKKPKYLHKITFANASSQFYANIMNMLKYLEEIES